MGQHHMLLLLVMVIGVAMAGHSPIRECTAPWVSITPWLSIGTEISKGCFLFVQERMNWDDALHYCVVEHGGVLVNLETESKRRDLITYMESQGLRDGRSRHLGATDRDGYWQWLNGNNVTNGWRRYDDAEPDDDSGDDTCMYLYTDPYPSGRYDLLSDYECTTERYFICEKAEAATCKPKNKCKEKRGTCIPKSETCYGKIIKNGCKTEGCDCCVAKSCTPQKSATCIPKSNTCLGKIIKKACKTKGCDCCAAKECIQSTECTNKGGMCQSKTIVCDGMFTKRDCKGETCGCCFHF